MTDMSYQNYQDGRQQGEAASYYNDSSNPPYGSSGDPNRQQGYGGGGGGGSYPSQNPGPGEDGERGLMGGLAGAAAGGYGGHKMGHGVIGAIGGAIAGHKLQDFVHDRKEKKEDEKVQEQQQQQQQQQHHGPPASGYTGSHYTQPHHSSTSHHHHHEGRHSPERGRSPGRDRSIGGRHDGNFSASSHDIHLEGDYDLRATCRRQDGGSQVSILNLNGVLSNEDGQFRWARGGSGGSSVTVSQGDTLREIARRYNCGFDELARRNNLANPDMIYPGQVLQVPGGSAGNFSSSARDIRLVDGGRVLEAELRNGRGDWHRSRIDLDERIGNENGRLSFV